MSTPNLQIVKSPLETAKDILQSAGVRGLKQFAKIYKDNAELQQFVIETELMQKAKAAITENTKPRIAESFIMSVLMSNDYIAFKSDSNFLFFQISEVASNIFKCTALKNEDLLALIARHMRENYSNVVGSASMYEEILRTVQIEFNFINDKPVLTQLPRHAILATAETPSQPQYCFNYILFPKSKSDADYTEWTWWLSYFSDDESREAFSAYLYSIFNGDTLTQAFYFYSKGRSGKSEVFERIIAHYLGNPVMLVDKQDRFWPQQLLGQPYGVVNELSKINIINTSEFKALVGRSSLSCEGKYQNPIQISSINCPIIILSNNTPLVKAEAASLERLIYCSMESIPQSVRDEHCDFTSKCIEQLPAFLHAHCKPIYEKLINKKATMLRVGTEALMELSNETTVDFQNVLFDFKILKSEDKHEFLTANELQHYLEKIKNMKYLDRREFITWLSSQDGIFKSARYEEGRKKVTVYNLKLKHVDPISETFSKSMRGA